MTQPHPTPTSHGAWRVIDGQLVNEDSAQTNIVRRDTPLIASTDTRIGGPGIPVPPADESEPVTTPRKTSTRK